MKIAVFHNLPSGGGKRALYGFVRYLVQVGHQVDVRVPSTADEHYLPLKDIASGFHVYPVRRTLTDAIVFSFRHVLAPFPTLAGLERTQKRIAQAINAGPCDVVFSEQDLWTLSPFFLRYVTKPTVYYCQQPSRAHETVLDGLLRVASVTRNSAYQELWGACLRRWHARIDRENASYAKYILTNSYFTREAILRSYGVNSFVSYLGIDTALFRPLGSPKGNFILSTGTCTPNKGYDFIIRALSLIDKRTRPKLLIVANRTNAHWEAYLVETAAKLDVNLEIRTYVPDSEIVDLYNQAKLFVYAAILEPFGLAPLEAMGCGTPVVAVKEGGPRETVLHNETGILSDRDEPAFAEAVTKLLENEDLRKQMGERGTEVVRKSWTLEQAGERLIWHLKRVQELP